MHDYKGPPYPSLEQANCTVVVKLMFGHFGKASDES